MKNSDEMVKSLFERRERYETKQRKKKRIITHIVVPMFSVCVILLVGFGVLKSDIFSIAPDDDTSKADTYTSDTENSKEGAFSGNYWVPDENSSETSQSNVGESEVSYAQSTATDTISNTLIDVIGMVKVEGVTYVQADINAEKYTIDTCLGDARDFDGTYQMPLNDLPTKLYTTKEDSDILIVKLSNGGIVVLKREKE